MKPNKKDIEKWCQALRSREYEQGANKLQSERGFCCLGVACDLFIEDPNRNSLNFIDGSFPYHQSLAPEWLKMVNHDFESRTGILLSMLSDVEGLSFDEIADLLEVVYVHEVLDED